MFQLLTTTISLQSCGNSAQYKDMLLDRPRGFVQIILQTTVETLVSTFQRARCLHAVESALRTLGGDKVNARPWSLLLGFGQSTKKSLIIYETVRLAVMGEQRTCRSDPISRDNTQGARRNVHFELFHGQTGGQGGNVMYPRLTRGEISRHVVYRVKGIHGR